MSFDKNEHVTPLFLRTLKSNPFLRLFTVIGYCEHDNGPTMQNILFTDEDEAVAWLKEAAQEHAKILEHTLYEFPSDKDLMNCEEIRCTGCNDVWAKDEGLLGLTPEVMARITNAALS